MAFAVLSLVFPATMVETCASMGLDSFASRYAALEYSRSGDIADIARASEYAIFAEDDELIAEYGTTFVNNSKFFWFADQEGGSYRQYVQGRVASSLYRLDKTNEALDVAFRANDNIFPKGNSIISLSICVIDAKDQTTAKTILGRLDSFSVPAGQVKDLENVKTLLKEITNE